MGISKRKANNHNPPQRSDLFIPILLSSYIGLNNAFIFSFLSIHSYLCSIYLSFDESLLLPTSQRKENFIYQARDQENQWGASKFRGYLGDIWIKVTIPVCNSYNILLQWSQKNTTIFWSSQNHLWLQGWEQNLAYCAWKRVRNQQTTKGDHQKCYQIYQRG